MNQEAKNHYRLKLGWVVLLSVLITGNTFSVNKWPEYKLGGSEKLFLNEEDFIRIRITIDNNEWAAKRFEVLKKNNSLTEEEYFNCHWNQNWRQWTTGQYIKELSLYYRLTGDTTKLSVIKSILTKEFKLNKTNLPLFDTDKKVSNEAWNWGMIRVNYLWAWDMIKSHPSMDAIKEPMRIRLNELMHRYIRFENENIVSLTNTRFWGITFLGLVGILNDNKEVFEHATSGKYGFKTILETQIRDNKFWPEPMGYSKDYVMCGMLLLAEASRVNGFENLYQYESKSGASLKKMVDGYLDLCFPNGLLASNGDHSLKAELTKDNKIIKYAGYYLFNSPSSRLNDKLEILYRAYKDPKYAWLIEQSKERVSYDVTVWGDNTLTYGIPIVKKEVPAFKDGVYPEYGHAMISNVNGENYWKGENVTLHLRNGCMISHGHNDAFHIELFAYGKQIYPEWYRAWEYLAPRASNNFRNRTPLSQKALGHNTVVVDKKNPDFPRHNQVEQINDITFSGIKESGNLKYISLTGSVYKGVSQKRTLGITSNYLLDIFECSSDDIHIYDYILHDEGVFELVTKTKMTTYDGFSKDYQLKPIDSTAIAEDNVWLRNGKKSILHQPWQGSFIDNQKRRVNIFVGGEKATEVFLTNTPFYINEKGWDSTPDSVRKIAKPMLIVRRNCKSTSFIVVHQLTDLNNPFKVNIKNSEIDIRAKGFHDLIKISGDILIKTSK
jgi:hypothetical protein